MICKARRTRFAEMSSLQKRVYFKISRHKLFSAHVMDPYLGSVSHRILREGKIVLPRHEIPKCINAFQSRYDREGCKSLEHMLNVHYYGIGRQLIAMELKKNSVERPVGRRRIRPPRDPLRERSLVFNDEEYAQALDITSKSSPCVKVAERSALQKRIYVKVSRHHITSASVNDPYLGRECPRLIKDGKIILPQSEFPKCVKEYHSKYQAESARDLAPRIGVHYYGIGRVIIQRVLNQTPGRKRRRKKTDAIKTQITKSTTTQQEDLRAVEAVLEDVSSLPKDPMSQSMGFDPGVPMGDSLPTGMDPAFVNQLGAYSMPERPGNVWNPGSAWM